MRFTSLGSGSRGNALVVEARGTRVMLDCGFTLAETTARLARVGLEPSDIDAVLVTHEHDDHVGGVGRFARKAGSRVYATSGTLAASAKFLGTVCVEVFDPHAAFEIDDLRIEPYPVPHDAREPAQFVFDDGRGRLGVLTDAGASTPHIEAMLTGCAALVLECNHDEAMLANGPYPASLKARVASRYGHLANAAAATLLARLDSTRLRHLVAAHLSETNNTPALAQAALAGALGCEPEAVIVASQSEGFGWLELHG